MICNNFWCPECDDVLEYRYRSADRDSLKCHECGEGNLEVRLSAPSFKMSMDVAQRTKSLKKRALDDDRKHFRDREKAALEKAKI
jgi:hypothetical protein